MHNKIGNEGGKALAKSLMQNTTLTELSMSIKCFLLTATTKHIFTLRLLNKKKDNKLGSETGKEIGEMLKINTSLTKIDLSTKIKQRLTKRAQIQIKTMTLSQREERLLQSL